MAKKYALCGDEDDGFLGVRVRLTGRKTQQSHFQGHVPF
jgi:hypothetical protein